MSENVYDGQSAHRTGATNTETNGCDAGTLPHGTPVEVDGATRPGTIVLSSWVAMQAAGEADDDICQYNDLALIRVDAADYGRVNPTIPFRGGPTGITDTTATGDKALFYGVSSLRLGITQVSPKEGIGLGASGGGWTRDVHTLSPGIPGDSGSAFIDSQGRALGVLGTLQAAPLVGSNGVSDFSRMVSYMKSHGGPAATLAPGTEAFRGPLLP